MMKYKLLFVTSFYPPYHVGGAGMHVYYLANEMAKRGHQIDIVFSIDSYELIRGKKKNKEYKNHKNITLHPIQSRIGKLSPLYSYMTGKVFDKKVKDVIEKEYDLIHYHNISLFGPKVFDLGKSPKIYTAHDHWLVCPFNDLYTFGRNCKGPGKIKCQACLLGNKRPLQMWRWTNTMSENLKNIQVIISPSEYLKNFYKKFGIKNKFEILPNFVAKQKMTKHQKHRKKHFIFVGMLEKIKGIENLLEAFRESSEKLLIAGTGSLEKFAKDYIKKYDMKNVTLLGFVHTKELGNYLQSAKALIMPTVCNENNPLSVLEALSFGIPVICSNRGGLPEITKKIESKLVFENVSQLRKIINQFDSERYNREEIRKIQLKNYSDDSFIKKYLKIIENVKKNN